MYELEQLGRAIWEEISGPNAGVYLLALGVLLLIRIAWELARMNRRAAEELAISHRLDVDMKALAEELRELRTEIRQLVLDMRRLIDRR